jgi:DNA-binding transcriptional MerR regulator
MNYSIKQVAEKLGISKHTLYYYEKENILPPIQRDNSGNRIYTDSDISWIYLICCLRDIDMPMKNIREYIYLLKNEKSTLEERKTMITTFRDKIDSDIKKYLLLQNLIDKKLEYYNSKPSGSLYDEAQHCYNYKDDWDNFKEILEDMQND